jgi:hypothetical protein
VVVTQARAQGVVVAPHAVYVDHRDRSAALTLYNPGAKSVEVAISSLFAYPVTDSAGQLTLFTPDSIDPSMPSAAGWIEAFPKRMVLAPLQRQTVRLLARPPQGLADGEYWSRIVISAKEGSAPVAIADSADIQVGLSLEVRTIIPLTYRKGAMTTGLQLSGLRASPSPDSLHLRAHLTRTGTGAYIGTARGTLVDSAGRAIATFEDPVAVYYEVEPVFAFPTAGLRPGRYRVRLELASERPDITPDLLLHAAPVRDSLEVRLP